MVLSCIVVLGHAGGAAAAQVTNSITSVLVSVDGAAAAQAVPGPACTTFSSAAGLS